MIITAVTDEVLMSSEKIEKVFETAVDKGITHFEIRSVEGSRFPMIEDSMVERLKALRRNLGITFTAASPGIFKVPLASSEFDFHRGTLLENTMAKAERLDIDRIIIFSIKRDEERPGDFDRVAEELGSMTIRAQQRGFTVLIENEPGWWADTSENCLRLLKAIDLPGLKLNWDPGNLFGAGEYHYKTGYDRLKKFIANVHLKDARKIGEKVMWVPMGQGEMDIKGQVEDLKRDGYDGCITIETHCTPLPESFESSLSFLKGLL